MVELAFHGHHLANQLVCDTLTSSFLRSGHTCLLGILKTGAYRWCLFEVFQHLSCQTHPEKIVVSA